MITQLKSYKREFEHSYSFGVFPTLELLKFRPEHVLRVLLSSRGERNEGVQKIQQICGSKGITAEVNDKLVERLSPKENAYAVGVFSKYSAELDERQNHVVLVNPGDMGNLGTIVRTMIGFGVSDLGIVRPAVDIFDPRVVRASMGAIFQLSFQYFDSFNDYSDKFSHNLYPFMTNGKVRLAETAFKQPFTLVFGNESSGLPEEYGEFGTSVTIEHTNRIDSLNLPIAVSIALYEAIGSL